MKEFKKNLINTIDILNNYIYVMLNSLEEQNKYLDRLGLVVEVYDKKSNHLIVDAYSALNEKLIKQLNYLNTVNTKLLKIKRLDHMLIAIKAYKVFDLDEVIIPALEKQNKFVEMCERKGFVSSTSKACFQQSCGITSCMYLTSIKQLEICRNFLNMQLGSLPNEGTNDLTK